MSSVICFPRFETYSNSAIHKTVSKGASESVQLMMEGESASARA
jgi:hypothetical protein